MLKKEKRKQIKKNHTTLVRIHEQDNNWIRTLNSKFFINVKNTIKEMLKIKHIII